MSKPHRLAFLVTAIGVLIIMSSVEVDAQSTVDDGASCESSTFDEAVNLIKEGMNNVGLIREDLKAVNLLREDLEDVKNVLGSKQQQSNASSISKKDLEDIKAAFDASSQQQKNASGTLKKDLEDLKAAFDASNQKQNNASSILMKELEDLKSSCASNEQPCPQMELSKQAQPSSLLCEYRTRVTCFP